MEVVLQDMALEERYYTDTWDVLLPSEVCLTLIINMLQCIWLHTPYQYEVFFDLPL